VGKRADTCMYAMTVLPTLVPRPLSGGEGWYVQIDWQDFSDQVGAFATHAEALDWIEHKSADWLRRYKRPAEALAARRTWCDGCD